MLLSSVADGRASLNDRQTRRQAGDHHRGRRRERGAARRAFARRSRRRHPRDADREASGIRPGHRLFDDARRPHPQCQRARHERLCRRPRAFLAMAAASKGWRPKRTREKSTSRASIYAAYLADVLDGLRRAEGPNGRLHTVSEECVAVATTAAGVDVRLANGTSLIGHVAVLAVGHEEHPVVGKDIAIRPGSEADTAIDPDAAVLILGTGLSMVDAWVSLAARGHRGRTIALSRRGLISVDPPQGQADPAGCRRRAARHRPFLFRALVPRPGARDRARRRRLARRRRRHPAVQPAHLAKLAGERAAPLHRAHARLVGRAPPPHAAGAARARFARDWPTARWSWSPASWSAPVATATALPRRSEGEARRRLRR